MAPKYTAIIITVTLALTVVVKIYCLPICILAMAALLPVLILWSMLPSFYIIPTITNRVPGYCVWGMLLMMPLPRTLDYFKIEYNTTSADISPGVTIDQTMSSGEDLKTTAEVSLTIDRDNPKILFVDCDSGWNPSYSNLKCYAPGYEVAPLQILAALAGKSSDYAFHAINLEHQSLPAMASYPIVFWTTGKYPSYANSTICPITSTNRTTIQSYLDGGGKLFLTGEATCPSLGASDTFVCDYLQVASTQWEDTGGPLENIYLNGANGDPISDGLCLPYDRGLSSTPSYQHRANKVSASAKAGVDIFHRSTNGNSCAVRQDNGTWRSIHLAFDLVSVGNIKQLQSLIQRSLDWLDAPTAIELVSFTAEPFTNGVILEWETALEVDTVGFNLWRSTSKNRNYQKITPKVIPSQGGASWGARYFYRDIIDPAKIYYYKLEEIDYQGKRVFYGPIKSKS